MVSWFRLTSLTQDFVSKLECRQPTKCSSSSFGCHLHESWRIERCHRRGDRAGVVGFDDDDDDDDDDDHDDRDDEDGKGDGHGDDVEGDVEDDEI